jgi:hypothetical protein
MSLIDDVLEIQNEEIVINLRNWNLGGSSLPTELESWLKGIKQAAEDNAEIIRKAVEGIDFNNWIL